MYKRIPMSGNESLPPETKKGFFSDPRRVLRALFLATAVLGVVTVVLELILFIVWGGRFAVSVPSLVLVVLLLSASVPVLRSTALPGRRTESSNHKSISVVDPKALEQALIGWSLRNELSADLSDRQKNRVREIAIEALSKISGDDVIALDVSRVRQEVQALTAAIGERTDALYEARAVLSSVAKEALKHEVDALRDELTQTAHNLVWGSSEAAPQARMASRLLSGLTEAETELTGMMTKLRGDATSNLLYGVIFAMFGFYVALGGFNFVLKQSQDVISSVRLIAACLGIEIFAFFFLRVYRSVLTDIRYIQNELVNIRHKRLAICAAIGLSEMGDSGPLKDLSKLLADLDRNSALQGTNPDLERRRIEAVGDTELIKAITDLVRTGQRGASKSKEEESV